MRSCQYYYVRSANKLSIPFFLRVLASGASAHFPGLGGRSAKNLKVQLAVLTQLWSWRSYLAYLHVLVILVCAVLLLFADWSLA